MANGKLEARITIPTGNLTMDFVHSIEGSKTITLTAANTYYWSSAGNDSVDLAAKLAALLNAAFTAAWTVTLSAAEGTSTPGRLTIAVDSGTFTTANTAAALQTLLGMTGGEYSSGAASQASPGSVRALWMPDGPPNSLYGDSSVGWSEYDAASSRAPDGTVVGTAYYETRINSLSWPCSRRKVVLEYETVAGESFEQFYRDSIFASQSWATACGPVRWYPDADTDASYFTYFVPLLNQLRHERLTGDWVGWFRVDLAQLIEVP